MKDIKRKCIVSNKIVPTTDLIRFVLLKNGNIVLEKNEKILGRGAYCLNQKDTIDKLFLKKMLNRSFKMNIPKNVYLELQKEVEKYVKIKK